MRKGSAPLQILPAPMTVKRKLCSCLMVWKRWEFLLEYLVYHTRVHGLGHTILISQDQETLNALKWLQAYFSVEAGCLSSL
eukprot:m.426087 g.426087  ORF g.426087 m.426087 type:complete len:81 (+) comp56684_c0_seq12:9-251(+)